MLGRNTARFLAVSAGGKKAVVSSDKRYALLRDMLYSEASRRPATTESKPLINTQDRLNHELVERMHCLIKQREEDYMIALLSRQRVSMHAAALALERVDIRLFHAACGTTVEEPVQKAYVQGEAVCVFSPKLRVPTESLPNKV